MYEVVWDLSLFLSEAEYELQHWRALLGCAYLGVITMIMIIITTTATILLIIMIIKLEFEHHHWQASTSLEPHVRDLDSKEEVDSFQRACRNSKGW